MCNIWKSSETDKLEPEHMASLPPSLKTINISGGEPFLRNDLPEFVSHVRKACPSAQITISTNAYLPQRIEKMMDEIIRIDPTVRLAVSLDGIGGVHDKIRGDDGVFDSAMGLIDSLKAKGFQGLRLGMTLSKDNLDQLIEVAQLAGSKGLELGVVAAHAATTHLGVEDSLVGPIPTGLNQPFEKLASKWLRSARPKYWLRGHFAANTFKLLSGRPWKFTCHAGEDFFFCQADGSIFSCSVKGQPMGSIIEQSWDEIWSGNSTSTARNFSRNCSQNCWMICTARSVYRRRPLAVLSWILLNKPLAHLGCFKLPQFKAN